MEIKYFHQVKDAGDYREFVARRYGAVLTFGGDVATYRLGIHHVSRLAQMVGMSFREVLADVQADYKEVA